MAKRSLSNLPVVRCYIQQGNLNDEENEEQIEADEVLLDLTTNEYEVRYGGMSCELSRQHACLLKKLNSRTCAKNNHDCLNIHDSFLHRHATLKFPVFCWGNGWA